MCLSIEIMTQNIVTLKKEDSIISAIEIENWNVIKNFRRKFPPVDTICFLFMTDFFDIEETQIAG